MGILWEIPACKLPAVIGFYSGCVAVLVLHYRVFVGCSSSLYCAKPKKEHDDFLSTSSIKSQSSIIIRISVGTSGKFLQTMAG